MNSIIKLAKEEFDSALETYRTLTEEIKGISEKLLAFEPNAVEELQEYAIKLHKAYNDLQEKEVFYYVADAEHAYAVNEDCAKVKACAEVREAYQLADKAVDDAMEIFFEASKERDSAQLEYAPIVEAPVSDPERYEFARTKLNEAKEQYEAAEKQVDMEIALWHEARKQYASRWKEVQ